ncbi:unnamed protein product [Spirodela intermedia]|uniref:Uncharacterized protein n=1 Tax=Spirodela intermedia TaxID=51605 RepID=A0ABN7EE38_SPIIN|nr:unnamed protein product [Spirodela intermedia]
MRSSLPILRHLKMRLRGRLEYCKGKKREIKAQSMQFSCSRLSWKRDYLERIKIVTDQALLGLELTHNKPRRSNI